VGHPFPKTGTEISLQQAILPTPRQRFTLGGYHISVLYRPADLGSRVGGDWYDMRQRPEGGGGFAIGDVAGHGLIAAAGMTRIGNALRGLSVTGKPPGELLGWLNDLVCQDESPELVASAAIGWLDGDRPALRWAQAGHPPPVLLRDGEPRLLTRPAGLLLGTEPTSVYELATEELSHGDLLFFYTDGLIERRGKDIDEGLLALLCATADIQGEPADDMLEELLARMNPPVAEDDVCLLAIRVG
jgi:serine phosphatase RsbU (regulator of sigma subunit)